MSERLKALIRMWLESSDALNTLEENKLMREEEWVEYREQMLDQILDNLREELMRAEGEKTNE